jgi:hypothetical protein
MAVEGASLAADLHRRQSEALPLARRASSDLITGLNRRVVTYQSPSSGACPRLPVEEIGNALTGC